uniref:Chemokine interleukin-8-like domain-containing protein n=1 Tax=Xiphophorus maculatus TaxID=8083 RepID=A0A3B5R3E2_XIPMA
TLNLNKLLLTTPTTQCLQPPVKSDAKRSHYPTGKNRPCCLHVSRKNLSSQVVGSAFHKQPARFPCVRANHTRINEDSWVQQGTLALQIRTKI